MTIGLNRFRDEEFSLSDPFWYRVETESRTMTSDGKCAEITYTCYAQGEIDIP